MEKQLGDELIFVKICQHFFGRLLELFLLLSFSFRILLILLKYFFHLLY